MADDADRASKTINETVDLATANIRAQAASIPKGEPGECEYCGEYKVRLVKGACGRCRDQWGLG